jgi:sugar lactone lactonase YvrE
MEKCRVVSDHEHLCGECPRWDPAAGHLWWSDMLAGEIYCYTPGDGPAQRVARGRNVSGLAVNEGGGLVCACHEGLFLWDQKSGFRLVADSHEGTRLRSNDAIADARGRFLFGTTYYVPDSMRNYQLGKLYKVERNGTLSILEEGIHLSNGLGFSPDGGTLYYTDTVLRSIYAYSYNQARGEISNRRIFVKLSESGGIPDGLAVDAEGYVWSALWYGACLVRYDPCGEETLRISTPMKQTSSLAFGGQDFTDIYVTTAAKSVRLSVAPDGYDFNGTDIGGPVYCFNVGIKGKPDYVADIHMGK